MIDLGPLPERHPRDVLVDTTIDDLDESLMGRFKRDEMTSGERVKVIAVLSERLLSRIAWYAMKHERGKTDE